MILKMILIVLAFVALKISISMGELSTMNLNKIWRHGSQQNLTQPTEFQQNSTERNVDADEKTYQNYHEKRNIKLLLGDKAPDYKYKIHVNESLRIPCRPKTQSQSLELFYIDDEKDKKIENFTFQETSGIRFQPHISGTYAFTVGDGSQNPKKESSIICSFYVKIQRPIVPPVLSRASELNITLGETVSIRCKIVYDDYDDPTNWLLDWETTAYEYKLFTEVFEEENNTSLVNELRIPSFSKKKEGNYTCTTGWGDSRKSTSIILKLIEPPQAESPKIHHTNNGEKSTGESNVMNISLLIAVIICLVGAISIFINLRRLKKMRKKLIKAGLIQLREGAPDSLNPALTVSDQAELLPYDEKWEFPRDQLKLGRQLGNGAFGVVMEAQARGICNGELDTIVAVKMVRQSAESTEIRALVSEMKIMSHLGKHLNVLNLLGACTNKIAERELLVIFEYCRFGNLHAHLLKNRSTFVDLIDPVTQKISQSIASISQSRSASANLRDDSFIADHSNSSADQCVQSASDETAINQNSSTLDPKSNYCTNANDQSSKFVDTQDLLSWSFQVASGMEYLSGRKVLHGDLAARNILLADNNVVKICDFGLSKYLYKDNNYKKKSDSLVPMKWMAIESIKDNIFSTQSDVWSFGIVLWEFFSLAETPYAFLDSKQQFINLILGYRLKAPKFATKDIYDIMFSCWKPSPNDRPSFCELVKSVGDLLNENVRIHYEKLNGPFSIMNSMMREEGKNDYLTMLSAPDHNVFSSPTTNYVMVGDIRNSVR